MILLNFRSDRKPSYSYLYIFLLENILRELSFCCYKLVVMALVIYGGFMVRFEYIDRVYSDGKFDC